MSPRPLVITLLSLACGFAAAGDVKVYRANEIVDPLEVVRILEGSAPRARIPAARAHDARADDPNAIRTRSIRLFDDPLAPPLAAKTTYPSGAAAAVPAAAPQPTQPTQPRIDAATQARAAAAVQAQARAEAATQARADTAPARAEAAPQMRADVEVHAAAAGDITRHDPKRSGAASVLSLPVQFAFDSAEILSSARAQLDALAAGVQMLPESTRVVIEGHTDAAGSDDYNQQLSLRRAQSVKRYLVAVHGIEPSRLRAMGLGEDAPLVGLAPTAPENRRVQFRGER